MLLFIASLKLSSAQMICTPRQHRRSRGQWSRDIRNAVTHVVTRLRTLYVWDRFLLFLHKTGVVPVQIRTPYGQYYVVHSCTFLIYDTLCIAFLY